MAGQQARRTGSLDFSDEGTLKTSETTPRRQGAGWAGPLSLSQQRSLASWEGVEAPPAHGPLVPRLS